LILSPVATVSVLIQSEELMLYSRSGPTVTKSSKGTGTTVVANGAVVDTRSRVLVNGSPSSSISSLLVPVVAVKSVTFKSAVNTAPL